MQAPYPPRPPFPPRPGSRPEESDRNLLARVGEPADGARALALLLARHWPAAYEYAVICLASPASTAEMAATAAFHQVLGEPADGALRPRLLAAVRDTVRAWAADDGVCAVVPELRKPVGARGLLAARSVTPEKRRLAERAFQALPGASQCLLWHTEVEAESITVPAGLLGVDAGTASAALEQAREQFRAGCVRAHRELAPSKECRFYNRLLDVPMRRGGRLLPDVQRHLMACRYCRHAAEQLSHFESGLEALLAETVLGWGAHRYLDSRPGRTEGSDSRPPRPPSGGRHRLAPRVPGRAWRSGPPGQQARALAVGMGLLSLALLVTLLAAKGWSDESGGDPYATWGAPSANSARPGVASAAPPSGSRSAASAGNSAEVAHGRLRSLDAGLCLDPRGGRTVSGARIVLAACSSAPSQQWSYQDDGLLRSAAHPTLCLDADADEGTVLLADCLVHAGEVRYDLTVRGELLLRGGRGRAVATGPDRGVVVATRDGSTAQRWRLETGPGSGGGDTGKSHEKKGEKDGTQNRPDQSRPEEPQSQNGTSSSPEAELRHQPEQPQKYDLRVAPVANRTDPDPVDAVRTRTAGIDNTVGSATTSVAGLGSLLR